MEHTFASGKKKLEQGVASSMGLKKITQSLSKK